LLNFQEPYVSFGSSIFSENHRDMVMTYLNGQYQILNENFVASFDGENLQSLYNYQNDKLLKSNLVDSLPAIALELENAAKARIQSFNYRMNHNELHYVQR
jgi:hypothetical protein